MKVGDWDLELDYEDKYSECCGAPIIFEDICKECKEHTDIHYRMPDGSIYDQDGTLIYDSDDNEV